MPGSPRLWLLVAVAAFAMGTGYVLRHDGGPSYWPGLVTSFGASVAAFLLALEWESQRQRAELRRTQRETNEARSSEARKRLLVLVEELKRNQESIDLLQQKIPAHPTGATFQLLHPQLLDGAWSASRERLGDLLANYDLIASLSTFYGRLEELRWRVRHRTEARDRAT